MLGAFENIHDMASSELSDLIRDFIKTLRWTQCSTGAHSAFSSVSFKWSMDKENWQSMPYNHQISGCTPRGISTDSKSLDSEC